MEEESLLDLLLCCVAGLKLTERVREKKSAKITKLIKSGKGFLHDFRPGVWRKLIRLINLL